MNFIKELSKDFLKMVVSAISILTISMIVVIIITSYPVIFFATLFVCYCLYSTNERLNRERENKEYLEKVKSSLDTYESK